MVVLKMFGCIQEKVVVFGKMMYWGKTGVIRAN